MTRGFTSGSESSSNRFQVFDFNADDELVEKNSAEFAAKLSPKFRNPKMKPRNTKNSKHFDDSPITKYTFLQAFAQVTKNLDKKFGNESIDVDAGAEQGTKKTLRKKISTVLLEDDASGVGCQCTLVEDGATTAREEMTEMDACVVSSSSNYENKQVCTISDDEGRLEMRSSSILIISPSKNKASLEELASEPGSSRYETVETAIANLHLQPKDSIGGGNANKTSGIDHLRCAAYDPHWLKAQEATKSLDVLYGDIQNFDFEFDKPFEDVIYPKGDPDAVCISNRDLERLQPETFINDTIIDFYIQYLKSKIQPEEKPRFHFFNSFFFRKLADLEKDPSTTCEGNAAFQRVYKWTRKVSLFEKDYIFVPVNYSFHWSLIVICHPGQVANFEDEEIESLPKVPCILHMDSIKGSHRGLKNLFQRYLCEEWKERHGETAEDDSLKFLHLRFFELELPQQENSFDCGLFMLHYVECFLEEAPVNFSPFKIRKSNFLNKTWFLPAEASLKRFQIKKLIFNILEDHSREALIADCINEPPSSSSNASGIRISSVGYSPPRHVWCFRESGLVQRESYEPGICSGLLSNMNFLQFDGHSPRRFMSPIEEVEDTGDGISVSPVDMEDFQEGTGLTSELLPKSCFGKGFSASQTSWNHGFSKNIQENVDGNSISEASSSGSQNLSAVGTDEDHSVTEIEAFNYPRKTNESEFASSGDFTGCVVPDSEEENDMEDGNEVKYFASSEKLLSHQEADLTEIINLTEFNTPLSSEDPVSESDDQKAPKRPRLVPPVSRKQRLPRFLIRALHL